MHWTLELVARLVGQGLRVHMLRGSSESPRAACTGADPLRIPPHSLRTPPHQHKPSHIPSSTTPLTAPRRSLSHIHTHVHQHNHMCPTQAWVTGSTACSLPARKGLNGGVAMHRLPALTSRSGSTLCSLPARKGRSGGAPMHRLPAFASRHGSTRCCPPALASRPGLTTVWCWLVVQMMRIL